MERIHFKNTATPILLNKMDGKPVLLLVYKEKDKPEDCTLDARWDMETVAALSEKGLLTGTIKILNDSLTQLIDIKLAIEERQRKFTESLLSKKSIIEA